VFRVPGFRKTGAVITSKWSSKFIIVMYFDHSLLLATGTELHVTLVRDWPDFRARDNTIGNEFCCLINAFPIWFGGLIRYGYLQPIAWQYNGHEQGSQRYLGSARRDMSVFDRQTVYPKDVKQK
jgi:hypothetical protein